MSLGADEVVSVLKEAGVRYVFGIPSIHNISLYDALRDEPSISHILCRQETTATHMADGYARAGNKLGVVITSTGPGAAYALPALHEAFGCCSSVLMITTNLPVSQIGKGEGALHELDCQIDLFRNVSKASISIRSENQIYSGMKEAVAAARSGRPGPVCVEIPTDLLRKQVERRDPNEPEVVLNKQLPLNMDRAVELVNGCERPLIVTGTEAVRAEIGPDILALAEKLAAPVITPTNGKGIIPEDHPLAFGNAARQGVIAELTGSCDLALAVGTRLRAVDAKRRGLQLPDLIHIDWDSRWINRNYKTETALTGNIRTIVKDLTDGVGQSVHIPERLQWLERMRSKLEEEIAEIGKENHELDYLQTIRRALPRESTLVIDNTILGYWAEYFYPSFRSGGLISARGASIIGFAFAAAAGAKITSRDKPVAGLIGDGGFLYSSHELATCMRHNIGFPLIVVNDSAFGVIDYLQRTSFNRSFESKLHNPDFVALARAYGAEAVRVESPEGLARHLHTALNSNKMWVIELAESFREPPFGKY